MSLLEMSFAGSVLILAVIVIRALTINLLSKKSSTGIILCPNEVREYKERFCLCLSAKEFTIGNRLLKADYNNIR